MKKLLMIILVCTQISCMEKNTTNELAQLKKVMLEKLPTQLIVPIFAQVLEKELHEFGGIPIVKNVPIKKDSNVSEHEEYWQKLFSCPGGLRTESNAIYYKDKKIIDNTNHLHVWGPNKKGIMLINDRYIFKIDTGDVIESNFNNYLGVHPLENKLVNIRRPAPQLDEYRMPIPDSPYHRIFTNYQINDDNCCPQNQDTIRFYNYLTGWSYDLSANDDNSFLAICSDVGGTNQRISSVTPGITDIISLKEMCKYLAIDEKKLHIDSYEQSIENPKLLLIYLKQSNEQSISHTIFCKRNNKKAEITHSFEGHIQFFGQQRYRWRYLSKPNDLPDGYLKIMPIEEYVAQMKLAI